MTPEQREQAITDVAWAVHRACGCNGCPPCDEDWQGARDAFRLVISPLLAEAERAGAERALREAASPEVSEWARKRTEDELVEMRDAGIFMIRRNGLVVYDRDGSPSNIIRLGFEMAWASALIAHADQIASQP